MKRSRKRNKRKRYGGFKGMMDKHHRLPTSRGGTSEERNVVSVPANLHRNFHALFGNRNAAEICRLLTEVWVDPDYVCIAIPRYKTQPKKKRKQIYCTDCEAVVLRYLCKQKNCEEEK